MRRFFFLIHFNMKDFNIEERVIRAKELFLEGYNCAQSVFLAYSDLYDIDADVAKSMSVSFGGGIGRMREVCGVVSAMAMLAGFKYPVKDPRNITLRTENYAMVQKESDVFKEKYHSIVCRDLLPAAEAASKEAIPSVRTPQYYEKRPCLRYVADAARIAGNMIQDKALDHVL